MTQVIIPLVKVCVLFQYVNSRFGMTPEIILFAQYISTWLSFLLETTIVLSLDTMEF